MKYPEQLNGNIEWRGQPRQQNRVYSITALGYVCKPEAQKVQNTLNYMRMYHAHPQVNGGLRTFEDASAKCGGIEASYWKGYDTRGYRPYVAEIYPL